MNKLNLKGFTLASLYLLFSIGKVTAQTEIPESPTASAF